MLFGRRWRVSVEIALVKILQEPLSILSAFFLVVSELILDTVSLTGYLTN